MNILKNKQALDSHIASLVEDANSEKEACLNEQAQSDTIYCGISTYYDELSETIAKWKKVLNFWDHNSNMSSRGIQLYVESYWDSL